MGHRLMTLAAIAVVASGCTGVGRDTGAASGRLAIVDASGNVVAIDPDGTDRIAVTQEAGASRLYMQPVWSPDGSLLTWGQATEDGFAVRIVARDGGTDLTLHTPNLPFYTFWSPTGEHLGLLHNGTSGVEFRMVDVDEGSIESLDEDAPFYFSWSPDGARVVTHAGESRTETLEPGGGRLPLAPTDPDYLAPQWTPAGIFEVVDGELVLEAGGGDRRPVTSTEGFTYFVANPQGTMVALQAQGGTGLSISLQSLPEAPPARVAVVDVGSGDLQAVGDGPSLGFFWSPDGRSLLTLELRAGESRVFPMVWTDEGETVGFSGYRPSAGLIQNMYPFFPQYAQSVSFWAPDSSAFAFAGEVDGEAGIWVQHLDEAEPVRLSGGTWVAWSTGTG